MTTNPTRRTILSGAALATLAADVQAASADDRASGGDEGTVSVHRFGAAGDGQFHPLSSRFSTLEQARRMLPGVESLAESLDGAAIQAAIDHAAALAKAQQGRWCVHVPAGRYRLSRSLRLPNSVILVGDGIAASFIDNQNTPLFVPLIVNADPGAVSMTIHDLSLHGGTHGVRIETRDYVDGYDFTRVSFQLQSDKNVECNKLLQVGAFTGCVFAKAPFGLFVAGWTTNLANFYDCRFEDHSRTSLHLNGAECVNFFGGRFEAGGDTRGDEVTIRLSGAASVNFYGVYFEGTHPVLLHERRSRNGVSFTGCHFTGGANSAGPPGPYRFDSDGMVTFGTNDWGTHAVGPQRMFLNGSNSGLNASGRRYFARSEGEWHAASEQVALAGSRMHEIIVLRRPAAAASIAAGCVMGALELMHLAQQPDGGTRLLVNCYRFVATAPVNGPLAVSVERDDPSRDAAMIVLAVAPEEAGSGTAITARVSDELDGVLQWTLRASAMSVGRAAQIELSLD